MIMLVWLITIVTSIVIADSDVDHLIKLFASFMSVVIGVVCTMVLL